MAYAVVDAQGTYGPYTRVQATFETLEAADKHARAGSRRTVIEHPCETGERVHSQDAVRYEARADATRAKRDERRSNKLCVECGRPASKYSLGCCDAAGTCTAEGV